MEVEKLQELKTKIDEAKKQRDRANWEIEQIEAQWKEKYGCNNLSEVNIKLKELQDEEEALEKELVEVSTEIEKVLETIDQ